MEDEGQMAFNKDEELEMKYNVPTNAVTKKRSIQEVSAPRSNPFAKNAAPVA